MISLRRYTASDAEVWNAFVGSSRNGTFLFDRGYMDYHADRFHDHSLLCFDEKERLVALLPANEVADESGKRSLWSHQGLTYGGFVLAPSVTMVQVMQMFEALLQYAHLNAFHEIYYKQMPDIYHLMPSQEDEYALWRMGAMVESCLISTAMDLQESALQLKAEYCRRNSYNRLVRQGYRIDWEAPLTEYWPILTQNLQSKHGVSPVHTLEEIERLKRTFDDEIQCCVVRNPEGCILGGALMFETVQVAHVQYSAASEEGKQQSVLDYLYLSLLNNYAMQQDFRFFDFGNSNEQGGHYLNESLIHFKESFGGRGVVYKRYKISVKE